MRKEMKKWHKMETDERGKEMKRSGGKEEYKKGTDEERDKERV